MSRNKEQNRLMCILEAEMEVGSLIVSLDLPVVEMVWRIGNIYLPQTVIQECLLSCLLILTFKVKFVFAASDELIFCMDPEIWLQKSFVTIGETVASYPLSSMWESCWVRCEQTLLKLTMV